MPCGRSAKSKSVVRAEWSSRIFFASLSQSIWEPILRKKATSFSMSVMAGTFSRKTGSSVRREGAEDGKDCVFVARWGDGAAECFAAVYDEIRHSDAAALRVIKLVYGRRGIVKRNVGGGRVKWPRGR